MKTFLMKPTLLPLTLKAMKLFTSYGRLAGDGVKLCFLLSQYLNQWSV